MLNQRGFAVWAERQDEQKQYANISTKGYKFIKTNKGVEFQEWLIIEFWRTDNFGKKFEAFREGKSYDTFYTLANAKRAIVQEVEREKEEQD